MHINQVSNNEHKANQAGVTLLIAVLILAGLTLISLSIATFTIQELRASRAIILSEPAIGAAESASEAGIWAIKRNTALIDCTSGTTSSTLTNNSAVSTCKSYGAATLEIKAGVALEFYLYDPNDPNGDIDLQGCGTCPEPSTNPAGFRYNTLTVTNQTGTNNVDVTVNRVDGTPVVLTASVPPDRSPHDFFMPDVTPGEEGRMLVRLESIVDATILVNTNQGMPNFPTIHSTGCSSKAANVDCSSTSQELFSRKIQVTVPQ
jgi:hypothetical protein